MKILNLSRSIDVPENVTVSLEGKRLTVSGPKGTLTKDFSNYDVIIETDEKEIKVHAYYLNKRKKAATLAVVGFISNMIKGVTEGYVYKSKIIYSHFPITVEPDNKKREIVIKNLYGGRKILKVPIVGAETKVRVERDDVIIEGIDKWAVGQTAANMQEICRLRGKRKKDPETFMDGIWVWYKE